MASSLEDAGVHAVHREGIDTGERTRLEALLRAKLDECGWRDEMRQYCEFCSAY